MLKDKCGIVGIHSKDSSNDVSSLIYYGLYALQHRGQESAGIAIHNNKEGLKDYCGMGLLTDVFKNSKIKELNGSVGIGHVRYSKMGQPKVENCQPFITKFDDEFIAVAQNGDIINSSSIKNELINDGFKLNTDSDAEVICNLLKREKDKTNNIVKAFENITNILIGAYSLVILINDDLFVLRDSAGMKPLAIARKDDLLIAASETVAFDVIGAKTIRDVIPGELIHFKDNQIKSYLMNFADSTKKAHCMFEYVYFARPDSTIDTKNVYQVRLNIGKALYREFPKDADVIIPIPDSSIPAAIGYSRASGIPYGEGLIKNRYVGRTFIMPTQEERELAVKLKINPLVSELQGKKIVIIDDSIVRGTTSKKFINLIRDAGVKEIHLLIGCPPVLAPCYYGVAMADKKQLVAVNCTVDQIKDELGVDSLGYISLDSLVEAIDIPANELCLGCLTENYPTEIPYNLKIED